MTATASDRGYELFEDAPLGIGSVPPGTCLLIAGPPMTGKEQLAYDVLATGARHDEGVLVATTEASAATVVERLRGTVSEDRLAIVDARGNQRRADAPGEVTVEYASSPSDLTGISIAVTECLAALDRRGVPALRLSFSSVSTLLSYLGPEDVFRFLHVFTAHVERAGVLGVFTCNETAHDDRTLGMVKAAFDGMLQTRETDAGDCQVRAVGLPASSSGWIDF